MVCKVSLSIDKIIIFKGALMSEKTKCLLVLNHVLTIHNYFIIGMLLILMTNNSESLFNLLWPEHNHKGSTG